MSTKTANRLIDAATTLADAVDRLDFPSPVSHVYNPLRYAWKPHSLYLQRYAKSTCEVLFLGMNPGPWGMAQTGIPFGEVAAVRDWLKITAEVEHAANEHPKRPVEGFACQRSEVSGRRLWGLFAERYPDPNAFFQHHFVANYCPLIFMAESARNLTPDKLPKAQRDALEQACDSHLSEMIAALNPGWVIGVGAFAEKCAARVVKGETKVAKILHPSPASPAANRGWGEAATGQLQELGIW
ncbi:MAG: single-stranded DNA-binding protein [Pirellulaceae bacterium]